MLTEIADGVHVHESEFLRSNSVVVEGPSGVLLVDPGITTDEMSCLATDLRERGLAVAAGFSTHPDWDHVLWHPGLGDVPRYGTAACAASIRDVLSRPGWESEIAEGLPPEHAHEIPMHLLGLVTGLSPGIKEIPWDGPPVRVIEHRAHALGHAALLIENRGVLVAGDMLSDILMPFLDLEAESPIDDYLAALRLFDGVADGVYSVIPGHGSVGVGDEVRARISQDRAYVLAMRHGHAFDDPWVGPAAPLEWLVPIHEWQVERLGETDKQAPL